ncbi:phosphoribosyltransferase [Ramlibacter sp. PS4R-6]|uniref:phosphoribosyltransferase n=1 Tax=Ramlibacter sp. PS4R-6 TaxID=3133438 RepID=UPI0030B6E1D7
MSAPRLPFADRREAGRVLAERLAHLQGHEDLLVLALPRGGVAVGYEVARALHAELDVFIVRKLGHPGHEEYAMGAIASGGVQVMNADAGFGVSPREVQEVVARERAELVRRESLYRGLRPPVAIEGRTVVVVDDGLATGATMRAAVAAIRKLNPHWLVAAVPVGASETCERLAREADEVVCAAMPAPFRAVGLWYRDFPQSTDEEVKRLLAQAEREHAQPAH